jgi:uncharacterized protein YegP (UPF0339 family)
MSMEHTTKFLVKPNAAGKWFWHAVAANGQTVATSGQPFYSEGDATRAAENVRTKIACAPIEVSNPSKEMSQVLRRLAAARVSSAP